jgi:hypothetical protein
VKPEKDLPFEYNGGSLAGAIHQHYAFYEKHKMFSGILVGNCYEIFNFHIISIAILKGHL